MSPAATDAWTAERGFIDAVPAELRAALAVTPLVLRHRVSGYDSLELGALGRIGTRLPPAWVTIQEGASPVLSPPQPKLALTAAGAIDALAERCLAVRLYHVQHTPELARLVSACLDEVAPELSGGPMGRRDASVFIGSAGQVAPVHCDRHHNLLLQVQGTKELMVGRFRDPARAQAVLERNFLSHLNLEVMPDEVTTYQLGPGDGIYLPPYSIHWTRCGPEASVALSCSFATAASEEAELVHRCNVYLRRLRLDPRGPGRSPSRDRAKATVVRSVRRLRSQRRRARAAS